MAVAGKPWPFLLVGEYLAARQTRKVESPFLP